MAALPLSTADAQRRHAPARPRRTVHTAELRLVPRRRRTAGLIVTCTVVLASMMLAAAVLHTRLAERQLKIDQLEQQVDDALARFEVLRGQRAELRSPGRLSAAAEDLGTRHVPTNEFVEVDRWVLARVIASTGNVTGDRATGNDVDPLAQFRTVKSGSGGAP